MHHLRKPRFLIIYSSTCSYVLLSLFSLLRNDLDPAPVLSIRFDGGDGDGGVAFIPFLALSEFVGHGRFDRLLGRRVHLSLIHI